MKLTRHFVGVGIASFVGLSAMGATVLQSQDAPQSRVATESVATESVASESVASESVASESVASDSSGTLSLVSTATSPDTPAKSPEIVAEKKRSPHSASKKIDAGRRVTMGKALTSVRFRDVNGIEYSNAKLRGAPSVWVFVDATCPCVKAYSQRLAAMQRTFGARGTRFIYVFSQPNETVAQVKSFAATQGYRGIVVRDADQKLLRIFDAQCTTEAFLFDRAGQLRYHGRIDDSPYVPKKVKNHDLKNALTAVLQNRPVKVAQTRAYACEISRL